MSTLVMVKAHPGAHKEQIVVRGPQALEIWVRQKSEQGAANEAVLTLAARHFSVPRKNVLLIRGSHTRNKIVKIMQ